MPTTKKFGRWCFVLQGKKEVEGRSERKWQPRLSVATNNTLPSYRSVPQYPALSESRCCLGYSMDLEMGEE